ncbi:MAG: cytochrome P450 [Myxococcaceae bacterium]|nr:cytochrome P450 [Myxococcaceae bacterium]
MSLLIVRFKAASAVVWFSLGSCLAMTGCAHRQTTSAAEAASGGENNVENLPLPPGTTGLPIFGETLAIADDMTGFLRERSARYGRIFRSNVFFRDVAFVSGPDAAAALLDPSRVDRAGGHPNHVRELFGGTNINMYNGPKHTALKTLLLEGFTRDAFVAYLPEIDRLVSQSLNAAVNAGQVKWADELRKLAIEVICQNVLGLAPSSTTDEIRADYMAVLSGMTSIPIAFPGTTYSRAKSARDRLLERFRTLVAEHRAHPTQDGLSRILAAKLSDGTQFSDEELVLELHHTVIAGYIVFGLLMDIGWQLHAQPEILERARAEVERMGPALDFETLYSAPYLTQVVMEAKRHAPILPLVFATAKETFALGGYRIPKGWGVFWALTNANMDEKMWTHPERFDPDRFSPERAEHLRHEHAFVPQGSGPMTGHKCLGFDYSTVVALTFARRLLLDYQWDLPAQDFSLRYDLTPVEPRDGLLVKLRKRLPPVSVTAP